MAFAQVDCLHIASSSTPSDLTGHHSSSEHVASGAFSPTQDADLLREAALRSRRARKQLSLVNPSTAPSVVVQNDTAEIVKSSPIEEDIRMEDATMNVEAEEGSASRPVNVDTEDGEIFEEHQSNPTGGGIELDTSGEGASPLDSLSNNISSEHGYPDNHAATSKSPLALLDNIKHIRPFLNMTATDLDEAKRLILDLLGMGVTPEYLVDCGISAQCLAVCFYEMNLRFPLNLDRSQINLPNIYDLDMHMQESVKLAKSARDRPYDRVPQNENGSSSLSAIEIPVPKDVLLSSIDRDNNINTPRRGSLPSPPASLPSRPVIIPSNLDELPYDEPAPAQRESSPSVRILPTGPRADQTDSAIVEEQKRIELLARKAAMDSIAKKRAAKSSPNPHSEELVQSRAIKSEDVDSAVDALLAAVGMDSVSGSLEQTEIGTGISTDEALPDYDSDAMVEDELDTRSTSISDTDEATPDPVSLLGSKQHLSPTILSAPSSPRLLPATPATHIRIESFDGAARSGTFTPPPPVAVPIAARKARPTASDFIDQAPPRPSSVFAVDTTLKRKRCFVDPQVWPKRLVIDLDSSDEEEDEEEDGGAWGGSVTPSTSYDRRSAERNTGNGGGGRPVTKQGHDVAAQMLLEKELQIKAMMQKIKMRELKKKTGSASASTSGTPVLVAANVVSAPEGVSARPPISGAATPPPVSPDAITVALEATRQETAAGVASTLKIQQEVGPIMKKSSNTEATDDNTLGSNTEISQRKIDKGKGKAVEPEDVAQDPQDSVEGVSAAASTVDSTQLDQQADAIAQDPSSTHFKTYRSPLAAFTSPNLQPPAPTDRQLPTIYWISSTAGQDQNTNRKLCQYEFPSGICKDQTCTDIHAGDLGASDDDVRKTVAPMFPNAGPEGLTSIVRRVRQSAKPEF